MSLAATGGAETHTLTVNEIPAHGHGYHRALDVPVTFGEIPGTTALSFSATTDDAGGGQAHYNMQPYLVLNYIIKT
jgi:microcystin-dependent protein